MHGSHPHYTIDADLVAGRKLGAADLRLLIVSLLAAAPRHGYEIMAAIQDRTLGYYRPSPGAMYPALTYIEESGLATVETVATRKRYRITPAADAFIAGQRERLASIWERLERNGRKLSQMAAAPPAADAVLRARAALERALHQRARVPPEDQLRIATILNRATADIAAIDAPVTG